MYEQQFNPYAANVAVVKEYFKRGKVLAMGILYLISAVLTVGMAIFALNGFSDLINQYMRSSGVNFYVYSGASAALSAILTVITLCVGLIITVLTAVGFILMYTGSRKENGSPKAGVTILFVLSIISMAAMILMCVGILLIVLLMSLFAGIAGMSGAVNTSDLTFTLNGMQYEIDPTAFTVIMVIAGVILALVLVYLLLYTIHRLRYYSSVRKSLTTVELQNKGAKAFGVMSVINAVFAGLSLTTPLFMLLGAVAESNPALLVVSGILLLSSVLKFIVYILDASIALGYKKHIDNMKYGYNGTPYEGISEGNYAAAPYAAPYQQNPYATRQNTYPSQPNPYAPQQNSYQEPAPYAAPVTPPAPKAPTPAKDYTDLYSSAPAEETEPEAAPAPVSEPVQQPAAPAFCTNCGASVTPDSTFCTNCGHRLR